MADSLTTIYQLSGNLEATFSWNRLGVNLLYSPLTRTLRSSQSFRSFRAVFLEQSVLR
jgi:hypothetical protein